MIPRRPLLPAALPANFGLDLGISPGWADIDEEDTLPNHADMKLRLQGDSVKREP